MEIWKHTNKVGKQRGLSSATDSQPVHEDNRIFFLFQQVQQALQHVPDFAETCNSILDATMDGIDAENCSLMLMDLNSGTLSIRAARGREDTRSTYYLDHAANGMKFRPGEGIAGWVLKEGRAVMLDDVKEEPRFVKADGVDAKVGSLICFPIREKDQVVGVFNISHSKKRAFGEKDKLAVAYISNQVGAALTSARFFLEIHEMDHLLKDYGESFSGKRSVKSSPSSNPMFIEVGEITNQNGIFIYTNEEMHRIKEIIDQVSNTDVTVLIQGESGVGKEVVARSIHQNSSRRDKPFVKVNCAALPSELLESELFGYEKGAFTGAYRQKPGKFEMANQGTIFLDEIAEMSPSLQAKLLQVLQDREFSRLGGKKDVWVDVRILAASNRNIEEAIKNGQFREDLYYRLNVVNITIPPLRERKDEIPIFVEYFLDKFGKKYNKNAKPLSDQTMKILCQYQWLGNVRELENVIQRYVVLGKEATVIEELASVIERDSFVEKRKKNPPEKVYPSLKEVHREAMTKVESEMIHRALEVSNWNRKKAAGTLNISYKALLYKMKNCSISKESTSL